MLSCARVIYHQYMDMIQKNAYPQYMQKDKNSIDRAPKTEQILIGNIVKQIDAMQESEEFARSFDQSRPLIKQTP